MFSSNSHRRSIRDRETLRNDPLNLLRILKRQDVTDETGKDETRGISETISSHNPSIPEFKFITQETTENSSSDSSGSVKNGDIIRQGLIGFGIVLTGIIAITMIIGVIAYIYRERLIRKRRSQINSQSQKVRIIQRKNSNRYRSIINLYTDNFKNFNGNENELETSDMTNTDNSKRMITSNIPSKVIRNKSLDFSDMPNTPEKSMKSPKIESPVTNIVHPISSPIAFPSASIFSNERASSLADNIAKSNVFQATRPAPPIPVKTKQQKNVQRTFQIHSNKTFAQSPEADLIHQMPTSSPYYIKGVPPEDSQYTNTKSNHLQVPSNMTLVDSRQDYYVRTSPPSQTSLIRSFPSPPPSLPSRYSDSKDIYDDYYPSTESAKSSTYILDGPTNLSEMLITLFQQLNNCFESHKNSKQSTPDEDLNNVTTLKDFDEKR
ncbi:12695_t:CDS:2 [Funneliformis mosseae]|uniref:12695_t:CDS:1 n=1 Tax=Funneliformis mosseae TaxID=27381 RepID=A0A9N8W5G5_FUNMO|nr:12695_t:CDS:2 [Funneliformis mosseae]